MRIKYRSLMADDTEIFARRARLSSTAIFTALALTLAAFVALAISEHEHTSATLKPMSPVSHIPLADPASSNIVPVVAR